MPPTLNDYVALEADYKRLEARLIEERIECLIQLTFRELLVERIVFMGMGGFLGFIITRLFYLASGHG